jgi:hypothetical protein
LPAIHAAQLEGLLTSDEKRPEKTLKASKADNSTDEKPNPTYITWVARDQAVLGYLLASLTRETLLHVSRCMTAVAKAWSVLAALYAFQSCARLVNTRIAVATTKKNLSVSDYYAKMCNYADELTLQVLPSVMMSSLHTFSLASTRITIWCLARSSPASKRSSLQISTLSF